MDPITAILSAASLAGGILGKQRKSIDINWLKQKFGSQAVSEEAMTLFNTILNSPKGQAIMANAQEQGQQFQRDVAKRSAEAGLSGGGAGAETGTGIFANSAAQGAGDAYARQERGNLYQSVLPAAQQMVQDRMQAYLGDRAAGGVQTNAGRTWQGIGEAAGTIGSMLPARKTAATQAPLSATLALPMNSPLELMKKTEAVLPPSVLRKNRFSNSLGLVQPRLK